MLLALHIAGGFATLGVVVAAVWQLFRKRGGYRVPAGLLPVLAVYQVATGVLLAVVGGSITQLCVSGGVYLAVVWVVQRALVRRLQISSVPGLRK